MNMKAVSYSNNLINEVMISCDFFCICIPHLLKQVCVCVCLRFDVDVLCAFDKLMQRCVVDLLRKAAIYFGFLSHIMNPESWDVTYS